MNLHGVLHNVKTAAFLTVQQLLYIHQIKHVSKVRNPFKLRSYNVLVVTLPRNGGGVSLSLRCLCGRSFLCLANPFNWPWSMCLEICKTSQQTSVSRGRATRRSITICMLICGWCCDAQLWCLLHLCDAEDHWECVFQNWVNCVKHPPLQMKFWGLGSQIYPLIW